MAQIARAYMMESTMFLLTAYREIVLIHQTVAKHFIDTMVVGAKYGMLPTTWKTFAVQIECICMLKGVLGNSPKICAQTEFLRFALYARRIAMTSNKYVCNNYPNLLPKPNESELQFIARTLEVVCKGPQQQVVLCLDKTIPHTIDYTVFTT